MLLEDASGTAATGKEKGAGLGGLAWKHSIYLMLKPARASSPSRLPQVQEPARKRPRSARVVIISRVIQIATMYDQHGSNVIAPAPRFSMHAIHLNASDSRGRYRTLDALMPSRPEGGLRGGRVQYPARQWKTRSVPDSAVLAASCCSERRPKGPT